MMINDSNRSAFSAFTRLTLEARHQAKMGGQDVSHIKSSGGFKDFSTN
ncbi:hypothetical protein [Salipaludibacillus neizhouensis]|nr:hypothetical protein [Salipaludibacillus neizhouensis]